MMTARSVLSLLLLLVAMRSIAADEEKGVPKEIEPQVDAVRRYLLNEDYPELFKDKAYRIRVEDAIVADLDSNGAAEVVILTNPHYRQSPTIVIFQLDKELKARRVFEGLAPGPLVPVTGQYLDSHTLGMAVDMTATAKPGAKPIDPRHLIEAALKSRLRGLVQYRNFFHADGREGRGTYVDMTHVDVPGGETNCAQFEFSRVTSIAIGAVWSIDPALHLAASVANQIYIYRIHKIDD